MSRARAAALVFGVVQVLTYYRPYPPGTMIVALACLLVLAVGTLTLHVAVRHTSDVQGLRRLAWAGLSLDTAVVLGLVGTYSFDPDTAIWAILYLLPVEGAMVAQLTGAVGAMSVAGVGYLVREVIGTVLYGVPFLAVSVSFRVGLGFLIAYAVGVFARDAVTERQRQQAATDALAQRSHDLLEMSQKLAAARAAREDLLGVTSHEMRTPLTAVIGYATTLRSRWTSLAESDRRVAVDAIALQARRLHDLVEDVLTVASIGAGNLALSPQELDVRRAIVGAAEIVAITPAVSCPDGLSVVADPVRLEQILVNLMRNAARYGRPPIEVEAAEHDGLLLLRVRDHGDGVPPDFVPELFEPFSQASVGLSRTAAGTGLGLTIVRRLAEAHGGIVRYRSGLDGGAVFEVELPLIQQRPEHAPEVSIEPTPNATPRVP